MNVKKLDRWLEKENVSSTELARYLGVSKAAISKWRERDSIPKRLIPILKTILSSDRRFLQGRRILHMPSLFE